MEENSLFRFFIFIFLSFENSLLIFSNSYILQSKEYNEFVERRDFMELAKITSKGQITLPISIRRMLNLKDGDKVAFIEKDGYFILVNPVSFAIDEVRQDFDGEAKRLGLETEEDVVKMIKDIRKERK